ncbi:MAG: glycoside hydrolase family 2 TIM barrel-domain containing protein [Actinomycetota bacterium]
MHPPVDLLQPELTSLNRLPMRAPLAFFADAEAARADRRPRRRLSLDGPWDFQLFDSPPVAGVEPRYTGVVEVPGCWTMQDVGDHPHYTNIIMPWPGLEAPETPDRNPTGCYRRRFELPKAWLADDLVLHLGGFESVAAVWLNGAFVGMGKDSRLASEFQLNGHAVAGTNQLDVMVIRYSDATWIEDQDHWWHGGLHRSVFVEARPRNRIDDLAVTADFEPRTGAGMLHVGAHVCGRAIGAVRVRVFDDQRQLGDANADVPMVPDGPPLQQLVTSYQYPGRVASIELDLASVRPWTAETPERYLVIAELLDESGRTVMAVRQLVGFRRVELRHRRFLVNGVPIVFHGVNRHDHHPDTGKVLTEADLRSDLESMKRHNINAVRCAHYPNDPRLLDLCDEIGLWVVDEANIECHARLRSVSDDPRYLPAMIDRVSRMVVRDRNHPSVVMWSLGNESGHGVAQDACAAWVRAADPSRPIHYEGAVQRRFLVERADRDAARRAPSARERAVTDVVCPMYTAVEVVEAWALWAEETGLDDRPLVLCEYSHAMGNSNGGFDRYAEAFHQHAALAGGFIWDWKDQGIRRVDENGEEYWAYGGHFGDEPNDANFCINGIVGPDGSPHPAMHEIAWGYQPVRVRAVRGRKVRVENRRAFTWLDDLAGEWSLFVDGAVAESGALSVAVAPGKAKNVDVPFSVRLPRTGDVQLQVCWRNTDGRVVAHDEIELRTPPRTDLSILDHAGLQGVASAQSRHQARVGDTSISWDEHGPRDLVVAGSAVTVGHLDPCLWRAPTDNDGVAQGWMSEVAGVRPQWVKQGLDQLSWVTEATQAFTSDDLALVVLDRRIEGTDDAARWVTRFVLTPESIVVDEEALIPDSWTDVPRVGSRFEVDGGLGALRWFGLGPHETYPDRRSGARTGIWPSSVAEQYHGYVVPQEHGAHLATRWFELRDADGAGFRFEGAAPFSFNARRHHDDALSAARTIGELRVSPNIEVHIDAAQRGLGTGACGPDTAPEHRVGPGEHRWRFTISRIAEVQQ